MSDGDVVNREPERPRWKRRIFGAAGGHFVEYFDMALYGIFAIYFAEAFFPGDNYTLQLLNTYLVYAIGYVLRPFGAFIIGRITDRKGRRFGLVLSVTLMATGMLLMGAAPTHDQAGYLGVVMLFVGRSITGFSRGGEYSSSMTYISEVAPARRRGLGSGIHFTAGTMGGFVAAVVLAIFQRVFTTEQLVDWVWRIPFLFGAVLAVVVFWIRFKLKESEIFRDVEVQVHDRVAVGPDDDTGASTTGTGAAAGVSGSTYSGADGRDRRGTLPELWKHRQGFFVVFILTFAGTITLYNYTNYMTPFLVNTVGLSRQDANDIRIIADIAYMIFLLGLGGLSDRVGRKPIYLYMAVGSTIATVPLMSILKAWPSYTLGLVISIVGVSFVAGYSSIGGILKAEQFPPHIRALGMGLPYALAVALFGGTVTPIALGLKESGNESLFFYYVSLCALIGVIYCIWRVPETRGKDMRAVEPDPAERAATPTDR